MQAYIVLHCASLLLLIEQVLEKARQAKLLGSSLEARVLLYVEDEHLRSSLQSWNQQPNTADPLRFMFIVSQVTSLPPSHPSSLGKAWHLLSVSSRLPFTAVS